MRFPVYFRRTKNNAIAGVPTLTSDVAPTFATTKKSNLDNILAHKMHKEEFDRVAVGFWYEGAGAATVLPVTLFIWDDNSGHWYQASTGSLTNGQMTYLRIPVLADPPQTQVNMQQPSHGCEVLIIVGDNASGDGTYHFIAGPDSAEF